MTDQPELLWSAATRSFYLCGVSSAVPDDVVPIAAEDHASLLADLANGAILVACPETGKPLAQRPTPTVQEIHRAIRAESQRRILLISPIWRQLNDLRSPSAEGVARFAAIDVVRTASDAIEELASAVSDPTALAEFPVAENPLWPSFGD